MPIKKRIAAFAAAAAVVSGAFAAHAYVLPEDARAALAASSEQHAPTASNLEYETVKNIAITAEFAGADADGDALTYVITVAPKKGEAVVSPDRPGFFVYTPAEGKTGSDSFTYVAVDEGGLRSKPATVDIKITRNAAKMTYADMDGNPAHLAAIRLAENGVLIGERLSSDYYFSPDKTVSRGEFVAMTVACLGLEVEPTSSTGFADDDETASWLLPYIAAARRAGLIQGTLLADGRAVFAADRAVTRAEAAVILASALSLPTATSAQTFGDMEDVPAWAEGAVNGALAAGIMDTRADGSIGVLGALNRADAAEMLYAAMCVEQEKETEVSLLTRMFT